MTRRYRNAGLHEHQKAAYVRNAYGWAKSEYSDYDLNLWEYCQSAKIPFFLITQPRRYCTLEMSLTPINATLPAPTRDMLKEWATWLLEGSNAPAKSKSVSFMDDGAQISGLEIEQAKKLADLYWRYLHNCVREIREGATS